MLKGSRKNGRYLPGETPALYGIGKWVNGRLLFMIEQAFTMDWSEGYAATWRDPPTHYFDPKQGHFLINFNKITSPVILGKHHSRSNYQIASWREVKNPLQAA